MASTRTTEYFATFIVTDMFGGRVEAFVVRALAGQFQAPHDP